MRSGLIGRVDDLEALSALRRERDPVVLSLTGPGGCGKTRLALAHAYAEAASFEDGVCLAALATIADPVDVPIAIAAALGLHEHSAHPLVDALVRHLAERHTLLVLDSCEHLLEAVAAVVDSIASGCPGMRILTTSRAPLGVAGEHVWQVPPLRIRDAIDLFVERASAARRTFTLDEHTRDSVEEICRRLDGLPLAIELAAARVNVLAVDDLLARLDDEQLLGTQSRLAEPRQRTLEATVDWSHDLLHDDDRVLFRRLAVFAGGWSVRAAEEVADGSVDALSRLADQSLIVVEEHAGQARHRFLEVIRGYAGKRLEAAGEADTLRRRHATFFASLAADAGRGMLVRQPDAWVRRLRDDLDNLRAANAWLSHADYPAALDMAADLWWFWFRAGLWHEGRMWLRVLLAGRRAETRGVARALTGLGSLAWVQDDHAAARTLLEESLALGRRLGLDEDVGISATLLSMEMLSQGEHGKARRLCEEGITLLRDGHAPIGLGLAYASLGSIGLATCKHAEARAPLEQSVAMFRALGDTWGLALAVRNLGLVAFHEGDFGRATELVAESLSTLDPPGDPWFVSRGLESMASIAAAQGEHVRAARLLGAGQGLRRTVGAGVLPYYQRDYDEAVARVCAGLGSDAMSAAWREGASMRQEQALAYALSLASDVQVTPLSRREREVLDLLARGLSNRAIAQELVISEKTAESHVGNILRKLNVANRAEAAVWAVQHQSGMPIWDSLDRAIG